MVYRRRMYRRRRTFRRTGRPIGGRTWGQTALRALSVASRVASIVNSELKYYDESNSIVPDNNSSTATNVTSIVRGIAQGDTSQSIDGASVLMKQIVLRWTCIIGASATNTRIRLALVKDTRPVATLPIWSDIFGGDIHSFANVDSQAKRFRIMMDKTFVLRSALQTEKMYKFFKKVNFHVRFNTSQVPVMNDILLCALCDEGTNFPTITINSRLRFYDN